MLAAILLLAAAAGDAPKSLASFSYRTIISDRTKSVQSAPDGWEPTWKEHVQIIAGIDSKDAGFSRLMRDRGLRARRDFDEEGAECKTFKTCDTAGSLDITEELISASPDLISVRIATWAYEAGMPHPHSVSTRSYIWSRRWHRLLRQADVFAVRPDRRLRRIAQSKFNNPEQIQHRDDGDGIPLDWSSASIGPDGIIWFYDSYELGGYLSAGTATISWSKLRPYLRRKLPFSIDSIRLAPSRSGR